jgi:exopolysaccharide production protein ExoQ
MNQTPRNQADDAKLSGNGFSLSRALSVVGLPFACGAALLGPHGLTWLPLVLAAAFLLIRDGEAAKKPLRAAFAGQGLLLAAITAFLLLMVAGAFRGQETQGNLQVVGALLLAFAGGVLGFAAAGRVGNLGRWYWLYFPLVLAVFSVATMLVLRFLPGQLSTVSFVTSIADSRLKHGWAYNRAAVLCVLLLPLAVFAVRASPASAGWRAGAFAASVVLSVGATLSSASASAKLALAVVVVTALLGSLSLRLTAAVSCAAVLAALAAGPFLAPAALEATRDWPIWSHDAGTFLERMRIWAGTEPQIREAWFLGHGLEHARTAGYIDPFIGERRFHNHPHSFLVQTWLDLGLVGVAVLSIVLVAAYRLLAGIDGASGVMLLCITNGLLAVWAVSHGMWQAWYIGLCGIVLMFAALAHHRAKAEGFGQLDNVGRTSL